ncbi:hypothetical protein HK102_006857 [Quaeritorhiza haematococci]|nr:hypothetical protein HK102_006857 [Quaeritorhiza haematococci]
MLPDGVPPAVPLDTLLQHALLILSACPLVPPSSGDAPPPTLRTTRTPPPVRIDGSRGPEVTAASLVETPSCLPPGSPTDGRSRRHQRSVGSDGDFPMVVYPHLPPHSVNTNSLPAFSAPLEPSYPGVMVKDSPFGAMLEAHLGMFQGGRVDDHVWSAFYERHYLALADLQRALKEMNIGIPKPIIHDVHDDRRAEGLLSQTNQQPTETHHHQLSSSPHEDNKLTATLAKSEVLPMTLPGYELERLTAPNTDRAEKISKDDAKETPEKEGMNTGADKACAVTKSEEPALIDAAQAKEAHQNHDASAATSEKDTSILEQRAAAEASVVASAVTASIGAALLKSALRSSSASIRRATFGNKKSVRFDAGALEKVCLFTRTCMPSDIPKSPHYCVEDQKVDLAPVEYMLQNQLHPKNIPPIAPFHISGKQLQAESVQLAQPSNTLLIGFVQVKNLAFRKQVFVRYSTNNWETFSEVPALYRGPAIEVVAGCFGGIRGCGIDRFMFEIDLAAMFNDLEPPPYPTPVNNCLGMTSPKSQLQFAVRYEVNGDTYWDNNDGKNYQVELCRTFVPKPVCRVKPVVGPRVCIPIPRIELEEEKQEVGPLVSEEHGVYKNARLALDEVGTVQKRSVSLRKRPSSFTCTNFSESPPKDTTLPEVCTATKTTTTDGIDGTNGTNNNETVKRDDAQATRYGSHRYNGRYDFERSLDPQRYNPKPPLSTEALAALAMKNLKHAKSNGAIPPHMQTSMPMINMINGTSPTSNTQPSPFTASATDLPVSALSVPRTNPIAIPMNRSTSVTSMYPSTMLTPPLTSSPILSGPQPGNLLNDINGNNVTATNTQRTRTPSVENMATPTVSPNSRSNTLVSPHVYGYPYTASVSPVPSPPMQRSLYASHSHVPDAFVLRFGGSTNSPVQSPSLSRAHGGNGSNGAVAANAGGASPSSSPMSAVTAFVATTRA